MTGGTVAVVATTLNEIASVAAWLEGIEGQTRTPDSVVIVDGGSSDGTWDVLTAWKPPFPVSVVQHGGANISAGRNAAIARCTCEIVAVTDAGTVAASDWLEELTRPFEDERVDVVSGFFVPVLAERWSRALAAATLPDAHEVEGESFQPSSRSVAFRRRWWDVGVRYPEWLDYCEDLIWDLALRRAGARFVTNTRAQVAFHVRPDPTAFFRQYYRYARGDGKAGLFAPRHVVRYLTYAAALVVALRRRPMELAVAVCLAAAYARTPVCRLVARDRASGIATMEMVAALPLTLALRAWGDVAKMAGYPAGLCWRWRERGTLGWKTTWKRTSPAGELLRPEALTRENRRRST